MEDDRKVILDYSESTPLLSPSGDEDIECTRHGNGSVEPITDAQNAHVINPRDVAKTLQPTDNKIVLVASVTISSTILKESAVREGSAAFLSVNVSSEPGHPK